MSRNVFSRYDPLYSNESLYAQGCDSGHYKVVDSAVFNEVLPSTLLEKCTHAVILASGLEDGTVYGISLPRMDTAASGVDWEVYVARFDHCNREAYGGFVHHGDWMGSRESMPGYLYEAIEASGIMPHLKVPSIPDNAEGSLEELTGLSPQVTEGFATGVSKLTSEHPGITQHESSQEAD